MIKIHNKKAHYTDLKLPSSIFHKYCAAANLTQCQTKCAEGEHIMGLDTGMLKMIFSPKNRRLPRCHIVGGGTTELIHMRQAVTNLHSTLDYCVENPFNYPTLAETCKVAALDAWNRMPPAWAQGWEPPAEVF